MSDLVFERALSDKEVKRKLEPSLLDELLEYFSYFVRVFLVVAVIYVIIRQGVFDSRTVSGVSMYPYFNYDEKIGVQDIIYLDLFTPKLGKYERGDVVVINRPQEECPLSQNKTCNFVKRVIGLPGERVAFENGLVYIYLPNQNIPIQLDESSYLPPGTLTYKNAREGTEKYIEPVLGPDEYYLLGDNRMNSYDSRAFGPVKKNLIYGILGREIFSFVSKDNQRRIRFFQKPTYNLPG
jgi:signal peptidase I